MFSLPKIEKKYLNQIEIQLEEFKKLNQSSNEEWFSELCFCILTANSQAIKAIEIQKKLASEGFLKKSESGLASTIKSFNHRFHNNKASYIVKARQFRNIKDILLPIKNDNQAREFLVENIKGIGYKEASHFLRNVGYKNVAIIDRHVLKFLHKSKLIDSIPITITPKKYIEFENILKQFTIPLDKLDLIIWCSVTGKVLK